MILEIAQIDVKPGTRRSSRPASPRRRRCSSARRAAHGMALQHSVEKPSRYRLFVQWETVENHTVDFRGSADFQEWRKLVGHCFASPPEVEHVRRRCEGVLSRPSPACSRRPYSPPWRNPRSRRKARSGQAFQEGPGEADARQGGAAGPAADRAGAGAAAQSRHRPGHRGDGLADRPAAAAGQFVRPPRGFLRRAPRAQVDAKGSTRRRSRAMSRRRRSTGDRPELPRRWATSEAGRPTAVIGEMAEA